jgi:hypothetical protein
VRAHIPHSSQTEASLWGDLVQVDIEKYIFFGDGRENSL